MSVAVTVAHIVLVHTCSNSIVKYSLRLTPEPARVCRGSDALRICMDMERTQGAPCKGLLISESKRLLSSKGYALMNCLKMLCII